VKQDRAREQTYKHEGCGAETSPSIEPVIVAQLVDFHPFLLVRRIGHRLCHYERL